MHMDKKPICLSLGVLMLTFLYQSTFSMLCFKEKVDIELKEEKLKENWKNVQYINKF